MTSDIKAVRQAIAAQDPEALGAALGAMLVIGAGATVLEEREEEKGAYVYAHKLEHGEAAAALLPRLVEQALRRLSELGDGKYVGISVGGGK